jgi:hypothetical protein
MIAFTTEVWEKLLDELEHISQTTENNLKRAERCYCAVRSSILKIKEYILQYHFKDKNEEILFFKEIKPQFLGELIYHKKVFYIEAGKPVGSKDAVAAYYKLATVRINEFFERNHILYIYYRMGRSDLDEQYFIRSEDTHQLLPEYSLDNDPKFSNTYSYKFAKMLAYERLNDYLQQELYLLEHPEGRLIAEEKRKHTNVWTDTKAALIELIYAIHARGSINYGKGDIKQIVTLFEAALNVQVGNFYRTFQSMRIRKKGRTPYLNGLADSLEHWMDNTDITFS